MFWIIFGIIFFVFLFGGLVYISIRDRRYEKKRVAEVMGKDLWDEISSEREESLERGRKFKKALEDASRHSN